jgi:hypothetical protein
LFLEEEAHDVHGDAAVAVAAADGVGGDDVSSFDYVMDDHVVDHPHLGDVVVDLANNGVD